LKFRMAKNSLFAVLLRSPWWISALIALVLALLGLALLPDRFRTLAIVSGAPFVVIAAISARRRWNLPSTARVAETHAALARMPWPAFADLLQHSFRRDGYTVLPGQTPAVDFELTRNGRRMLVCARRWKSARTGLEALRSLQAARDASDNADGLYIGLGSLTDTAMSFAAEHRIAIWNAAELAQALRGLPLGNASTR
jgi:restriction system protein